MASVPAPILIVEDDDNDVFLIERALRAAGVERPLRIARDGEEAIRYLEDRAKNPRPCLILLDVKMPRKTGLEVLRWLRAHSDLNGMPVLMVTSSDEPRDREVAEESGIEAYYVKPVSFEEMVRVALAIKERAAERCRDA
jgi:DNA-binding response OmpR family regulator